MENGVHNAMSTFRLQKTRKRSGPDGIDGKTIPDRG